MGRVTRTFRRVNHCLTLEELSIFPALVEEMLVKHRYNRGCRIAQVKKLGIGVFLDCPTQSQTMLEIHTKNLPDQEIFSG